MSEYIDANFSDLKGKTLVLIEVNEDNTSIKFTTSEGVVYEMLPKQECCERAFIGDICGELDDLVDSQIVTAEHNREWAEVIVAYLPDKMIGYNGKLGYWTVHILGTQKGSVTIRWISMSDYYACAVELFIKQPKEEAKL